MQLQQLVHLLREPVKVMPRIHDHDKRPDRQASQ
jgi:hypothetical protein